MYIDNERFVIDLEHWRKVTPKSTPQTIIDQATEGKTPACRWAALEWLSDCNFSNCGRTQGEHREFALQAYDLALTLMNQAEKKQNIPKNYKYLLLAIRDNAQCWFNENRPKNQFLSWRER